MKSISLNQFNSILACIVLLVLVLLYGKPVLIPLTFAIFFAMLTVPIARKLESIGCGRVWSSLICLFTVIIISLGIVALIFMQFKSLAQDMPQMEKRAKELVSGSQEYLNEKLNIPKEKQGVIKEKAKEMLQSSGSFIKKFLSNLTTFLTDVVLVIVFMFLFLYQREKYRTFFLKLIDPEDKIESKIVMEKISKVAQSYLTGRLISVLIFTVLFTAGFLIIGLKGAFLLAFIAALLTIVPYVGSIIGGIFPFAVALVTGDSTSTAFGALAVIVIVQAFDNYFIEPYIIGGEVHISGFFTILILFIGGLLWGAAGMILFIPMLGVAKIIFDNVKGLEPYGYLVGDQKTDKQSDRLLKWFKKLFKK